SPPRAPSNPPRAAARACPRTGTRRRRDARRSRGRGAWSSRATDSSASSRVPGVLARGLALGLAQHAQDVLAEQFPQVAFLPAAAQELGGDRRIAGDVLEADRRGRDAVEVGAEPDVVDAGDARDVLDVVADILHAAA